MGMLIRESGQIHSEGAMVYFSSPYNYIDSMMLMMYICTFSLKFTANMLVARACEYFQYEESWFKLSKKEPQSLYWCYWLNQDRYYWDALDPQFVADGLFAIANVLSFNRFSNVLPAAEVLGPMHTSLGRMMKNIAIFSCLLVMVLFAFMVGLHNLYWYYGSEMRVQAEKEPHPTTNGELAFGDLESTFQTVFWSLFGLGGKQAGRLDAFGSSTQLIERIGLMLYGTYMVATVIVLINMLIAMMTRSYDKTAQDADIEWKFSRTKLYMEYIDEGSTMPVPLNIIPNPYYVVTGVGRFIKRCFCFSSGKDHMINDDFDPTNIIHDDENLMRLNQQHGHNNDFSFRRIGRVENGPSTKSSKLTAVINEDDNDYQKVVEKVVRRYVLKKHREENGGDTSVEELKQDISSFRYEVLNSFSTFEDGRQELMEQVAHLQRSLNRLAGYSNIREEPEFRRVVTEKSKAPVRTNSGDRQQHVIEEAIEEDIDIERESPGYSMEIGDAFEQEKSNAEGKDEDITVRSVSHDEMTRFQQLKTVAKADRRRSKNISDLQQQPPRAPNRKGDGRI